MPLHYEAWCQALGEQGCDFPEPLFYRLGGTPTPKIVEYLNQLHGSQLPVDATVHRKEMLFLDRLSRIRPIDPVVHIVRSHHGRIPMAIVSGGLRSLVTRTLEVLGLSEHFELLITAEDVVRGKPDPEPFLMAAARLGVRPERCLVFEDSPTGVAAARAAGMQFVLIEAPAVEL
mgnify:CR=1 FL=1